MHHRDSQNKLAEAAAKEGAAKAIELKKEVANLGIQKAKARHLPLDSRVKRVPEYVPA